MNNVVFLSVDPKVPPDSYWDMALLKHLLKDCDWHYQVGDFMQAIVIIPGANQGEHIDKINKELSKLDSCKVIITSDERNNFPIDKLKHPAMEIYANYYTPKFKSDIRWLPIGPAKIRNNEPVEKDLDFFFSGQVTHKDRHDCVRALRKLNGGKLVESEGFAKGLEQSEYYDYMDRAKAAPAPNGTVNPDSFRLYEALEAGAVPIVRDNAGYWKALFGNVPFPVVEQWRDIPQALEKVDQTLANECMAWWERTKQDIKTELIGDGLITVVMPTSPIKSNPETTIIDETIASVRRHLYESKIIITFDGVRPEQEDLQEAYTEFTKRVLFKYKNRGIYPLIYNHHAHQVQMARDAISHTKTDLILYVEHDTPLTDVDINFRSCVNLLLNGGADLIRFHFEAQIPEPHITMMLDSFEYEDVTYIKTFQWSQRPHLATRSFYDRILDTCFTADAKSFIEDKMHGVVANNHARNGKNGWSNYGLVIYNDGVLKHSYHTDGREGASKWDESQVF